MPKIKPLIIDNVRYLSLPELAEALGYSIRWVYHLVKENALKGFKRGSIWYFHPDVVHEYIVNSNPTQLEKEVPVDVSLADCV